MKWYEGRHLENSCSLETTYVSSFERRSGSAIGGEDGAVETGVRSELEVLIFVRSRTSEPEVLMLGKWDASFKNGKVQTS